MKNKILFIDFEIIWKSIHASLDEDEQLLLDKWLAEDQKHRKYYEKVLQYYQQENLKIAEADMDSLWKQINKEKASGSNKARWMIAVAASVTVIIATLFVFLNSPFNDQANNKIAENADANLQSGKKKAILHLGDGRKIILGSGNNASTKTNGTLIEITSESVKYNDEKSTSNAPSVMHKIEVPKGGEFMLVLSDSTKVWLNSQSTLKYPSVFDKEERVVELTGEAYFEVTHRNNQQFQVITADQTITVLGTSFNVNYYPEDKEVVSTLVRGKIRVNTQKGSGTILSPGEQTVYDKESNEMIKHKVNVENFIAWKNGLFYFENESLGRIMTILSRWYEIEVVYKNPEQKKLRFTGTLKRYEGFENVIDLIAMTKDVKFNIKDNVIIIE